MLLSESLRLESRDGQGPCFSIAVNEQVGSQHLQENTGREEDKAK